MPQANDKTDIGKAKLQLVELRRLLKYGLMVCAGLFIAVFVPMAIARSLYGYDLEWMEGGMVDHVIRILDGGQLYVEPKLAFIPFTYTPLYFYVSAAFTAVLGEGYFPLRLVSILSALGSFFLIFQLVRRETGAWFYGLLSAGLFAGGFAFAGSWFDLAHVDSLFMLLLLAGIYLLRYSEQPLYLFLAGLLFWLSFMTKQTALVIAVAMSVYCLIYLPGWRKAIFPGTVAVLTGLSTLVLNALSDGWYFYYVFHLPQQKESISGQIEGFWITDMRQLYLALAVSLGFLLFMLVTSRKKVFAFYALFFTSMVGVSWLISNYQGAYRNDLIPALAGIAVLFGLGAAALIAEEPVWVVEKGKSGKAGAGERDFLQLLLMDFVLIVCLLQLLVLLYIPFNQLPSAEDTRAGDALVALLQQAEGQVFIPGAGYLPHMAGKEPGAHVVALGDVMNAHGDEARNLEQEYIDSIDAGSYDLVILDSIFGHEWVIWDEARSESWEDTTLVGKVFFDKDSFFPVTGASARPDALFIFTRDWDWEEVYRALGFVNGKPPVEVEQD